jgi:hypothetical protein
MRNNDQNQEQVVHAPDEVQSLSNDVSKAVKFLALYDHNAPT